MHERLEKIKAHLREHVLPYACAASAIVTAVATAIIVNQRNSDVEAESIGTLAYQPENCNFLTQVISKYGNKIGHPGNPVVDMTTGKRYESQTLAALSTGTTNQRMHDHLAGRRDHVNGHVFERVG